MKSCRNSAILRKMRVGRLRKIANFYDRVQGYIKIVLDLIHSKP